MKRSESISRIQSWLCRYTSAALAEGAAAQESSSQLQATPRQGPVQALGCGKSCTQHCSRGRVGYKSSLHSRFHDSLSKSPAIVVFSTRFRAQIFQRWLQRACSHVSSSCALLFDVLLNQRLRSAACGFPRSKRHCGRGCEFECGL